MGVGVDTPGGHVRVLVVDDHRTFAHALQIAVDAQPDMACVGTASGVEDAGVLAERERPEAVLLDVRLGDDDGLDLCARLVSEQRGIRVILVTAHIDADLVRRAAAAGACSLVPKAGDLDDLLTVLRTARSGGLAVHPELLRDVLTQPGRPGAWTASAASIPPQPGPASARVLSHRELEVLELLDEGLDVRRMARHLGVSVHTVRGHVKHVLVKLEAHSQVEALAAARRRGLIGAAPGQRV